jgi:hypothetical protein
LIPREKAIGLRKIGFSLILMPGRWREERFGGSFQVTDLGERKTLPLSDVVLLSKTILTGKVTAL